MSFYIDKAEYYLARMNAAQEIGEAKMAEVTKIEYDNYMMFIDKPELTVGNR